MIHEGREEGRKGLKGRWTLCQCGFLFPPMVQVPSLFRPSITSFSHSSFHTRNNIENINVRKRASQSNRESYPPLPCEEPPRPSHSFTHFLGCSWKKPASSPIPFPFFPISVSPPWLPLQGCRSTRWLGPG